MCCKDVAASNTTENAADTKTKTTAETTTLTSNIEDAEDVTENTIEIKQNDVIEAEPSAIGEVVVKITGEAVEVKLHGYNPC